MSRGYYSSGKRAREAEKARKKRDKAERRQRRRERGPREVPVTTREEILAEMPTVDEAMAAMEQQRRAPRGAAAVPCRLFVGGLSWGTDRARLEAAFAEHGPVADAVIVTDRDTGNSRGFGFVTMASRKDAAKAIAALDGADLDGRSIVVKIATERPR